MGGKASQLSQELAMVLRGQEIGHKRQKPLMVQIFQLLHDHGVIDQVAQVPSDSFWYNASLLLGPLTRSQVYEATKPKEGRIAAYQCDKSARNALNGTTSIIGSCMTVIDKPGGMSWEDVGNLSDTELLKLRKNVAVGACPTAASTSEEQCSDMVQMHVRNHMIGAGEKPGGSEWTEEEQRAAICGLGIVGGGGDNAADAQKLIAIQREQQLRDAVKDPKFLGMSLAERSAWSSEFNQAACKQHAADNWMKSSESSMQLWVNENVSATQRQQSSKNEKLDSETFVTEVARMRYEISRLIQNVEAKPYHLSLYSSLASTAAKEGNDFIVRVIKGMPRTAGKRYTDESKMYSFIFVLWDWLKDYLEKKSANQFHTTTLNKHEKNVLNYLTEGWRKSVIQAQGWIYWTIGRHVFNEVSFAAKLSQISPVLHAVDQDLQKLSASPMEIVNRMSEGKSLLDPSLFTYTQDPRCTQRPSLVDREIEALICAKGQPPSQFQTTQSAGVFVVLEMSESFTHYFATDLKNNGVLSISTKADVVQPPTSKANEAIFGKMNSLKNTGPTLSVNVETAILNGLNAAVPNYLAHPKEERCRMLKTFVAQIPQLMKVGRALQDTAIIAKADAIQRRFDASAQTLCRKQKVKLGMAQIPLFRDPLKFATAIDDAGHLTVCFQEDGPRPRKRPVAATVVVHGSADAFVDAIRFCVVAVPGSNVKGKIAVIELASSRGNTEIIKKALDSGAAAVIAAPSKAITVVDLQGYLPPSQLPGPVGFVPGRVFDALTNATNVAVQNEKIVKGPNAGWTKKQVGIVVSQNKKWRNEFNTKALQPFLTVAPGGKARSAEELKKGLVRCMKISRGDELIERVVESTATAASEVTASSIQQSILAAKANVLSGKGAERILNRKKSLEKDDRRRQRLAVTTAEILATAPAAAGTAGSTTI